MEVISGVLRGRTRLEDLGKEGEEEGEEDRVE
jgi:hypothetical protein